MMSTCNEGGESFLFFCLHGPCVLISLQSTHSDRFPRDTITVARMVLGTPTCAIAVPSGIRSLAHVARVKERIGLSAVTSSFLNRWRLIYLSLAGRDGLPTAQRLSLLAREFPVTSHNLLHLYIVIVP
jgi:hypothetical protein